MLTLSFHGHPLAEWSVVQEDGERGGTGGRVAEKSKLSTKEEKFVNKVCHEQVVLNNVLKIMSELCLRFL